METHEAPPSASLPAYLARLRASGFWGEVTLRFRNGEIATVHVQQTFLPSDLPVDKEDATP